MPAKRKKRETDAERELRYKRENEKYRREAAAREALVTASILDCLKAMAGLCENHQKTIARTVAAYAGLELAPKEKGSRY